MPSSVLPMMPSSDESTIAARWARTRSSSAKSADGAPLELGPEPGVCTDGALCPGRISSAISHCALDLHAEDSSRRRKTHDVGYRWCALHGVRECLTPAVNCPDSRPFRVV